MTTEHLLFALIFTLIAVALVVFWRFTNSSGKVEWTLKTTAPEPSNAQVAEIVAERDAARTAATALRSQIEGRS